MNTLTLRKIPQPIEQRLRQMAKDTHQSLNKTAVELLAKGVGIGSLSTKKKKYRDIAGVFPKWTEQEYLDFEKNTKIFDAIDESMWRA